MKNEREWDRNEKSKRRKKKKKQKKKVVADVLSSRVFSDKNSFFSFRINLHYDKKSSIQTNNRLAIKKHTNIQLFSQMHCRKGLDGKRTKKLGLKRKKILTAFSKLTGNFITVLKIHLFFLFPFHYSSSLSCFFTCPPLPNTSPTLSITLFPSFHHCSLFLIRSTAKKASVFGYRIC